MLLARLPYEAGGEGVFAVYSLTEVTGLQVAEVYGGITEFYSQHI